MDDSVLKLTNGSDGNDLRVERTKRGTLRLNQIFLSDRYR
jgi:hypothetical protein